MGRIVAGFASSHAYTFTPPENWDAWRQRTRASYRRRYGELPPESAGVSHAGLEEDRRRYQPIARGLQLLQDRFRAIAPDVWIVIGDDQHENFIAGLIPQFAWFTGDAFWTAGPNQEQIHYPGFPRWANQVAERCVESGFDLALCQRFDLDELKAHAHTQPLWHLDPTGLVPVIPLFINGLVGPAATPARCYALGQFLQSLVETLPDEYRIAVYASGGLSHFTASFPWRGYEGPHHLGDICTEFDERTIEAVRTGKGMELSQLTSAELLLNGNVELRQWLVLLGMIGAQRPEYVAYQAFYRGMMGMAVAYWNLD